MKKIMEMFIFREKLKVDVHEVSGGIFFEDKEFRLEALRMKHPAPCLAYSFTEKIRYRVDMEKLKKIGIKPGPILKELQQGKNIEFQGKKLDFKKFTKEVIGKKISFILDTAINENCYKISENSDLLIAEACFSKSEEQLAQERQHLTAEQIADVAKKSKVKKLLLMHISQRYDRREKIVLDEAKKIFKNSELAKDFMKIVI
jgi:ribonuclease Z